MMRLLACFAAVQMSVLCLASTMGLVPSTHLPDPGREVTFQVTGAPSGAQFKWDFTSDGRWDATTVQPWAKWVVPAGAWEVAVEVLQGGRTVARLATVVVADARLGAIRSVQWVGGVAEVTVGVRAKQPVVAPGLEETIPLGWVVGTVEGPDLSVSQGGVLYALWATALDPGMEVHLRYRLHPPAPGMATRLSGTVSGRHDGQRVEARVAGTVAF
jgi:hypothetical protein